MLFQDMQAPKKPTRPIAKINSLFCLLEMICCFELYTRKTILSGDFNEWEKKIDEGHLYSLLVPTYRNGFYTDL